jgi:hypothetical protein
VRSVSLPPCKAAKKLMLHRVFSLNAQAIRVGKESYEQEPAGVRKSLSHPDREQKERSCSRRHPFGGLDGGERMKTQNKTCLKNEQLFPKLLPQEPGFGMGAPGLFENWITKKQLAQDLGMSVGFVNKCIPQGLPHAKFGRAVRFRLNVVQRWLQKRS